MWAFFCLRCAYVCWTVHMYFNFSTLPVFSPKVQAKRAPKKKKKSPIRNMWRASHINVPSGQTWKWDRLVFHFHVLQLWRGPRLHGLEGRRGPKSSKAKPHARTPIIQQGQKTKKYQIYHNMYLPSSQLTLFFHNSLSLPHQSWD